MKHYTTFYMLLFGATAFFACSRIDETDPNLMHETPEPVVWSVDIPAFKVGEESKALTLEGNTLHASWTQGDAVTVLKGDTEVGTLYAQSNGISTHLIGEVTGMFAVNDVLTLSFLRSDYGLQEGTLEYIAAHCDYAVASVTIQGTQSNQLITTDASFVNQQAICKFSLETASGDPLDCTRFDIVSPTLEDTPIIVTPPSATREFYVAMRSSAIEKVTYNFTAIGSDGYIYVGTKRAHLENGNFYATSLTLAQDESAFIVFACDAVKELCVSKWDTNGDGELSYAEAATVEYILIDGSSVSDGFTHFDELRFFTSAKDISIYNSTDLTSVTVNPKVNNRRIGITDCPNLTSVTFLPTDANVSIAIAFYGCSSIQSLDFGNVGRISGISGTQPFRNCSSLEEIWFPDDAYFQGGATEGCNKLTTIHGSHASSDGHCFIDEGRLVFVVSGISGEYELPAGITEIGSSALAGCSFLSSVTIPESVESIGTQAFRDCTNLTCVTFPSTFSFQNENYYNANNLKSQSMFVGCPNLQTLQGVNATSDGKGWVKDGALEYVIPNVSDTYSIPSGITAIAGGAFSACSPSRVIVPNGVTAINGGFHQCTSLNSISLPSSLITIGNSAFLNCTGLTSITIPSSVETIGRDAFYNCTGLTTITIPSHVSSIGDRAFYDCSNLLDIICEATTPPSREFFSGYQQFTNTGNCPIFVPASSVDTYKSSWSQVDSRIYAKPTGLYLSYDELSFRVGDSHNPVATLAPSSSKAPISWSSNDTGIATVEANGKITAIGSGTTTITARVGSILQATCTVKVLYEPVAVDLGLSVKWASMNLWASYKGDYGRYWSWSTAVDYLGAADVVEYWLGSPWRMPTRTELDELVTNCTFTRSTVSGVDGYYVTGPNNNSIFLPLAGVYLDNIRYSHANGGSSIYLSSSSGDAWISGSHYRLHFKYSDQPVVESSDYEGLCSIRPVCP